MVVTNTQPIAPTPRKRKSLFPFSGLLRSIEYQGKGAAKAENVILKDGKLKKMLAPSLLFTRADVDRIIWMGGFKDQSGVYHMLYAVDTELSGVYILESYNLDTGATTYPLLAEANEVAVTGTVTFTNGSAAVSATSGAFTTELAVGDNIYLDGEYSDGVRILSITDDDNLVLESNYLGTGGAGNAKLATKHFTSTEFFMRQLGDEAYTANKAASDNLYSYDGTTFAKIANSPTLPRYLLLDGNRVAINELFSGEISAIMTDFEAGTGVQKTGRYATSITANGGIENSSGITLAGDAGEELHKVIPNNASDNVSAQTKFEGFNYTGQGIKNTNQNVMGKDFQYIINTKGIIEINPFDGSSRVLTDDGNIGRRWIDYDVEDAIIDYDSKHNKIVALVKDVGQFDTMIIVDLDDKKRAVSTQPNSFFGSLVNINGQLYGGSSIDGKVFALFDTFSDRDDTALQFKWIMEWDAFDGITTEDVLKQILIHANINARSSMIVKLYKNGSHEPILTETIQGSSSQESQSSSVIGTSGFYVFGLGGRSGAGTDDNSDIIRKIRKSTRIVTYTLEITEKSVYDFSVYDVIIEYKSRTRLSRDKTQPNNLF